MKHITILWENGDLFYIREDGHIVANLLQIVQASESICEQLCVICYATGLFD
jgi:hypothetical protein